MTEGSYNSESTTTETTADASGSNAETGGVVAASNGDLEVNAANNEASGEETGDGSIIAVLQDSNGNEISSESTEANAEDGSEAIVGNCNTVSKEETNVNAEEGANVVNGDGKIITSEITDTTAVSGIGNVVADDGSTVRLDQSKTEVKIEDSFNTKNEETNSEAKVGEDGNAASVTGDNNNLVQVGEVKIDASETVNSGNTNSGNTVTVYREEIDQSTTTTTITKTDESVKQIIEGGVKVGDIINNGGVQVTVVGANVNGDLIINVRVEGDNKAGHDGDEGDHKETIKYIVKHETVVVGGGASVVYAATVHAKTVTAPAGISINEIGQEDGCTIVEITAVGGPIEIVNGKVSVGNTETSASSKIKSVVLYPGQFYTVKVDFMGDIDTVSVTSVKAKAFEEGNFSILREGYSWQKYPDVTGQFFPAVSSFEMLNNPPATSGIAVIGATA